MLVDTYATHGSITSGHIIFENAGDERQHASHSVAGNYDITNKISKIQINLNFRKSKGKKKKYVLIKFNYRVLSIKSVGPVNLSSKD